MNYAGIDYHKRYSGVCIIDATGIVACYSASPVSSPGDSGTELSVWPDGLADSAPHSGRLIN